MARLIYMHINSDMRLSFSWKKKSEMVQKSLETLYFLSKFFFFFVCVCVCVCV